MEGDAGYDNYWWDAAPLSDPPVEAVAQSCDVAIVGAGFTGLVAALILARAGRSVQVFEKHRPGEGASTRNGGIASGTLKFSFRKMIDLWGLDRAKAFYGEGMAARALLRQTLEEEGIDAQFRMTGRFDGAYRAKNLEGLKRESELLNKHLGFESFVLERADQHHALGSDFYHGGLVRTDVGHLHPGLLHKGYLEKVLAEGVAVHAHTPVDAIRREGEGFEVKTARGITKAREVLVATNGYTTKGLSWARRRLVPIPSQIIATQPLSPNLMKTLMPKGYAVGETRHVYHYYRPSPDGTRIIFGGRAGAETEDPTKKAGHLRANMIEIFPELADVQLTHCWWGYVAYTFDYLPKIAVNDGIHYATGFCGSGVVWTRWLGEKVAKRILGEPDGRTVFDEAAFQTRPLYTGWPWFLPAVIGTYALRDRLGL